MHRRIEPRRQRQDQRGGQVDAGADRAKGIRGGIMIAIDGNGRRMRETGSDWAGDSAVRGNERKPEIVPVNVAEGNDELHGQRE
jgi:hypothetical protein